MGCGKWPDDAIARDGGLRYTIVFHHYCSDFNDDVSDQHNYDNYTNYRGINNANRRKAEIRRHADAQRDYRRC